MESGQTGTPEPTPLPTPTPTPTAPTATPEISKDELNWATLAHVLTLIGLFIPLLGNVLPPLYIWQSKKDSLPFAGVQALESLNFQISASIYTLGAASLTIIGIGLFILPILGIAWFVLVIIGTLRANGGEPYRYPANLRLIK